MPKLLILLLLLISVSCSSPPNQENNQLTPTITQSNSCQQELHRLEQELTQLREENQELKERAIPSLQESIWLKWVLFANALLFFILGAGYGSKAKTLSHSKKGSSNETKKRSLSNKTTSITHDIL